MTAAYTSQLCITYLSRNCLLVPCHCTNFVTILTNLHFNIPCDQFVCRGCAAKILWISEFVWQR